jgi:2-phosphoglycolate phosphatase
MSAGPVVDGLQAVLFDLDGTLIDSAPDLAGTANDMRVRRGLPALPYESLRPMVGSGARGMLGVAFGLTPEDAGFEDLRDEFLGAYAARSLRLTRIFAEMEPVLARLESAGLRWGVVTNKNERFTFPVVEGLGLRARAAVVIAGDTTPHAKPHPAPLLEAARRIGIEAAACLYVGDDLRDVQAGRAAGMRTAAAAWGYLGAGEPIEAWGADWLLDRPGHLLKSLGLD